MKSREKPDDVQVREYAIVGSESELSRWPSVAQDLGIAITRKGQILGIGNDKVKLGVCMANSVTGLETPDGRYLLFIDSKIPIPQAYDPLEMVYNFAKRISENVELFKSCTTSNAWVKVPLRSALEES